MANTPATSLSESSRHRVFKDRPTGLFVQAFADHIVRHSSPETFPGLYSGRIDRAEPFRLLRKFSLDRRKRPDGDMAPCPRCHRDNQYLEGALAYFPLMQVCAAIGHCCATSEALTDAEREYEWRTSRDQRETYLLRGLPSLAQKAVWLTEMRQSANEAQRVYQQFRRYLPDIHQRLRDIKTASGGRFLLTETRHSGNDGLSSLGFRGRGANATSSIDHDFGLMVGGIAVVRNYRPAVELDDAVRSLELFGPAPNEEQAIDLIVAMNEKELAASAAVLRGLDTYYKKFSDRLSDFWSFFAESNIRRIGQWSSSELNALPFNVEWSTTAGRTQVAFRRPREIVRTLSFRNEFATKTVPWEFTPYGST